MTSMSDDPDISMLHIHSSMCGIPRNCPEFTSEDFFPSKYSYKVIKCDIVETSSLDFEDLNFDIKLRVNVSSVEETKVFLRKLNKSFGCTLTSKMVGEIVSQFDLKHVLSSEGLGNAVSMLTCNPIPSPKKRERIRTVMLA